MNLTKGQGFPICVAIAASIRKLPPSTGILSWPDLVPATIGYKMPVWRTLDPRTNLDKIKSVLVFKWRTVHESDTQSDENIWDQLRPAIENDIDRGKLKIQTTDLDQIDLDWYGATPEVSSLSIIRISNGEAIEQGTLGHPRNHPRKPTGRRANLWIYDIYHFSYYPEVRHDLVDIGVPHGELIVVDDRIWFNDYFVLSSIKIGRPDRMQYPLAMSTDRCFFDFGKSK